MIGNFVIFGDSISTHRDFIPKEYPHYYCTEGRSPEEPSTKMRPEQTWWWQLIKNDQARLVLNNSWTGSTLGYRGYAGDCSATSSFIGRYEKLWQGGFFAENAVDTIFVYGGTNDCCANPDMGQEQYGDWKREDLFQILPSVCYFMQLLKERHPSARIVFVSDQDLKQEVKTCMENAAKRIGVECVQLQNVEKAAGHPTATGMQQIYGQIITALKK